MKSKDKKLTSVRLEPELFATFKKTCAEEGFTFQKLAERSMYLYLTDEEIKKKIRNQFKTLL